MKRFTERTICFLFDWLEADWLEYESSGNWWHRHVGAWAQLLWFRAHNVILGNIHSAQRKEQIHSQHGH
jgi:hypothetical protein